MNIQDLVSALKYSREQLHEAEKKLDMTSINEPELIDASIFECRVWEERCSFYNRKLKEAFKDGQKIPCQRYVSFGGRR